MRIAIIGHVEHVTVGRVAALPGPGDIAHLESPAWSPGGGGGIAFFQLTRHAGGDEIQLFTALGDDDAAAAVDRRLRATGARIHVARRDAPHTRDVVLITPDGERTIVVVGEPLHPRRADPLPWRLLESCDAAYFTAQDPDALRAARAARLLVVTARRRAALVASGVRADVVIGSASDPREAGRLADYPVPPLALVQTAGRLGGSVETAAGIERFAAPEARVTGGAYGAGDSFAGAVVHYLAAGAAPLEACARAAPHGAAVLASVDPLAAQLPFD